MPVLGSIEGLSITLKEGILGVTLGFLLGAIFGGLHSSVIQTKSTPNQGIRLSLRNAIFAGVMVGLIFGVILGALTSSVVESSGDLILIIVLYCFVGLAAAGLWYGGFDIIQHYTLRFILWYRGRTPLNYIGVLNYAAERVFLQKVGGGYIFIHRLLLEHFAAITIETDNLND
jgi:hypothetical protein